MYVINERIWQRVKSREQLEENHQFRFNIKVLKV
jgi:hypothetical protein